MKSARLRTVTAPEPVTIKDMSLQPASQDIWDKKYRLKAKNGQPIDTDVDATYQRVARALAAVEATPDLREHWYEQFLRALRQGAIPAGRITSNAGALAHKPATSTINCTVSGTIGDSMDDILHKVHEAGLTLKAGCVAPGTQIFTEHGLVTADQAVTEQHARILCYDCETRLFEMQTIERHITTHVPRNENIEIRASGVSLKTSIHHPVLIYRDGRLSYERADDVNQDDALVQHCFPWTADKRSSLQAWFAGAHLGDGSAYEKHYDYKPTRKSWARRAAASGRRLVFKIRAAEREVVERYADFFRGFCSSRAQVVATHTPNGTPVWDYTVASFAASQAAELIDEQIGAKTASLHVPNWIMRHPEKHFLPFLAGLIDTDGTVSRERGSATISTQNAGFSGELQALLGLFGVYGAISQRKPREHIYNGHLIRDSGGSTLKISDSAFLATVANYMTDSGKRNRILEHASQSGMYDRYVIPDELRLALRRQIPELSHKERQYLGFYHHYHERQVISRIWLERWNDHFPQLESLIRFARQLRPVESIRRNLDLPETFYDFTVERHNNYLAGNNGLLVIHNCGIGYEFSTLRPRGAYVSGAGAYTSGPLSFMDIYDKMCFTVSSAGGRRGAQMGTFDIGHPDVLEFIRAKRENGRLRQFNLSLLITEEFMQAVKSGTDWPLAFPLRAKELDESIDLDNPEQVIWREWPVHDDLVTRPDGKVACKIYQTIPAQRLWDLIMNSTYDYAEPGFILIDTANEMNNNWWCENIRASNPCVTADTWVQTSEGPRQVRKLIGKVFMVRVDGQDHASSPEGFFLTARKRVFRLETKQGFNLKLTSDHQILKVTGYAHGKPTTQWCAAGELQKNDKILLNNHRANNKWPGRFGDIEGFVLGQAFIAAKWHEPYKLYATKGSNAAKLEPLNYSSNEDDLVSLLRDLADDIGLEFGVPAITPAIESTSSHFYGGFLRGVFEKNASLSEDKFSGYSIRLKMPTVALLKGIQRMLLRLGIFSSIHTSQKELYIAGDNLKQFENSVGFDSDEKRHALYNAIESCSAKLFHERFTAIVQAVIEDGIEEVYDVQVPGIHCFDANGLHAHNCGEQMLPPYGSCLLGSINLTQFVRDPFTDRARFDWDTYKDTVAVFTRMLDNVVEINGLPLEQQRHEIVSKRRHGMGYLGLGSTLTMLRMKYGEPDSLAFTEQVTREMALTGWRTGLELAREKGPAPIMEQEFEITPELLSKRPEMARDGIKAGDKLKGKILHARYSRYMQQVAELDPQLIDDLAETGCRFTHHTSIAPTGTISLSLANNASNGIEPSFAHHYSRNVIREGRKSKEKVDVFSFELLAYRELINPHAIPYSEQPEEQLPDYFITADEVSPKQHVDIQAAAQKWIDSSISKTANVPTAYPYEDFKDIYRYAYEQGLKGCTTFRFNPQAFQGVLVKEQDLENTLYTFVLEDDQEVTVKGNEHIEYDGEIHTAANLFDALKEGYYGRY